MTMSTPIMMEIVGYAAAILTTLAYFPQAIKVLKHRETKAISLGMYVMMSGGIACWFIYGFFLGSLPVILANGITLVLAIMILVMKIRLG